MCNGDDTYGSGIEVVGETKMRPMIADLTTDEALLPARERTTSTGPNTRSEGRLLWNPKVWPRECPPRMLTLDDEVFSMETDIATRDGDGKL